MPLSPEESKQRYTQKVKPRYKRIPPSEKKIAIFLAGQAGSGKNNLGKAAINLLENKKAVIIDTDHLRQFHPKFYDTPPKDRYSLLNDDALIWRRMVIEDAIKENKNLLFDGTFSMNNSENEALMKTLSAEGYEIKLVALSVNECVSKTGITHRYFDQQIKNENGRFVPFSFHEKAYETIPQNIKSALEKDLVDNIHIFGRSQLSKVPKMPHQLSVFNKAEIRNDPERPVNAYLTERTRLFTKKELESYKDWVDNTVKLIEKGKGNVKEFKDELLKFHPETPEALKEQVKEIANFKINQIHQHMDNNKPNLDSENKHSVGRSFGKNSYEDGVIDPPTGYEKGPMLKYTDDVLRGNLGSDPEFKKINTSKGEMEVAVFSVAVNSKGEKTVWHNVQIWQNCYPNERLRNIDIKNIKKGDYVVLTGNFKKFGSKEEFVAKSIFEHEKQSEKVKERITLKGNVGQDPEVMLIGDKKVAVFSLAIKKEGSDVPSWQQVQLWDNSKADKDKIVDVKKGDFVEIKGYYGKEYTNSKGETKQDFILEESKILKAAEKQEEKKSGGMKI